MTSWASATHGSGRAVGKLRVPCRILTVSLLAWILPTSLPAQTLPTRDQCVACHLELDEERLRSPAEQFPEDVHGAQGFDCLSCHGRSREGDEGLDADAGFLSSPEPEEVPGLCGRCHSDAAYMRNYDPALRVDQVAEYLTSGHGRALMATGDRDVATCVSCHPAHRIRPPDDPASSVYPLKVPELCASCHGDPDLMARHDLPTDQLEAYRESVHGRMMFEEEDLTAPTCNDCHGNHGAAPPGVSSVRNVCGECHATMAEFFAASGHVEAFEADSLPGCATCHGHHEIDEPDDELLLERSESNCATCHLPGDPAGDEFRVMKRLIDSLEAEASASREVLLEAENLGMEVEEALFRLDEVSNALVKARTAVHAFRVEPVREEVDAGLATTAATLERGEEALYEHWFRRAGLALSAAVILLLVMALILKIRRIEFRVEQVVDAVEAFFRSAMMGDGGTVGEEEMRLAACALLMELAHADDDFSDVERRHLEELICRRFRVDRVEAETLVRLTREERERGGDIHEFTRLVDRHFTREQKHRLLDSMWGLVLSDGELAEHERRFMDEVVEQLGMRDAWREAGSRRRVRRWMRAFFGAMSRRWAGAEGFEDLQMAAAALLVELAYADEEFSEMERGQLEGLLARQFDLTPGQADRLVRFTEEHRDAGVDLREMTAVIAAHYTRDERAALVDAMWSLVLADGELATREKALMGEILELMGLEPEWLERRPSPGGTPTPPSGGEQ